MTTSRSSLPSSFRSVRIAPVVAIRAGQGHVDLREGVVDLALHEHGHGSGHRAVQREVGETVVVHVADGQPARRRVRHRCGRRREAAARLLGAKPHVDRVGVRPGEQEVVAAVGVHVGHGEVDHRDRAHEVRRRRGDVAPASRLEEHVDPRGGVRRARSPRSRPPRRGRRTRRGSDRRRRAGRRRSSRSASRRKRDRSATGRSAVRRTPRRCTRQAPRRRLEPRSIRNGVAGHIADRRRDGRRPAPAHEVPSQGRVGHAR